jgi:nitroreductase
MKAILERRSIRRFQPKSVSKKKLTDIARAGAFAASGGNRQRWRFIAVRKKKRVEATTDTLGWLNGWYPPAGQGPAAHIVILAPADASTSVLSDCAAAAQNIMLAAWDKGVGSCWFGSVRREQLVAALGVPAEWQVFAVVALGYPAEEAEAVESQETKVERDESGKVLVPKKPLESILSFDGFATE